MAKPKQGPQHDKQQVFIEEYLICWNPTEAARRAQYANPSVAGYRLLRNDKIYAIIAERLGALAMTANEVIARLAEHARGDMRDFVKVDDKGEPYGFNLSPDKPLHLIKKMQVTTETFARDDGEIQTTKRVTFELHDSQAALDKLARIHGLFIERIAVDWHIEARQLGISDDDANAIYQSMVNAARARLAGSGSGGSLAAGEAGSGGG